MINFNIIGLEIAFNVSQTEICLLRCVFVVLYPKNISNAVRLDIGITITSTYIIKEGAARIK